MENFEKTPLDQLEEAGVILSKRGWRWLYLCLTFFIGVITVLLLLTKGEYGWTLFLAIPFTVSFVMGFIGAPKPETGCVTILVRSLIGLLITGALLMAAGAEGGICFLMAAGLLILPTGLGLFFGRLLGSAHLQTNKMYILGLFILINPSTLTYDLLDHSQVEATTTTEIIINAADTMIWKKLTQKVEFNKSNNFFLKAGISYPLDMELQQVDNQCFLKCNTTNGFANLRVDTLIQNKKMVFKPEQEVVPMREMSIYPKIDAPHLHGYFENQYGMFEIEPLSAGQCRVRAQTHYTYRITPVWYWALWSDYLVDKMHQNVLNKIKMDCE
jgi:hypothetical protein